MSQTEEEYRKTYRSERERTVVLLGFLSIILAVRVELHEGDFWNFPCNSPCAHLTLWLLPMFTNWIILWLGYIACMLIYFSEDKFDKYAWGRNLREFSRRLGSRFRSEEHTSELQSLTNLVCRLLLEKKNMN